MSVGKYSPWEPTATLPSAGATVGSAARGATAPAEGGEGRVISWRPPAYSLLNITLQKIGKTNYRFIRSRQHAVLGIGGDVGGLEGKVGRKS